MPKSMKIILYLELCLPFLKYSIHTKFQPYALDKIVFNCVREFWITCIQIIGKSKQTNKRNIRLIFTIATFEFIAMNSMHSHKIW